MPDQEDRPQQNTIVPEPELHRLVRRHFAEARGSVATPSFESVLAKAEGENAVPVSKIPFGWLAELIDIWSNRGRWVGAAQAVAAAITVAVLVTVLTDNEQGTEEAALIAQHQERLAAAEQRLLASLESTTRWQAPSDRWLAVQTDISIFGLPDIGGTNLKVVKEKQTWL